MKAYGASFPIILVCAACGSSRQSMGSIRAAVLVAAADVTRVVVSIAPAGVTADLTRDPADASKFSGTFPVAAGAQTVTATAYQGAAVAGTGTAAVTVVKNQVAHVGITILDSTGADPLPDHSPVVTTFVVPVSSPMIGDQIAVSATAMDADGDALSYAWTAAPAGCATFTNAAAASTICSAQAAGTCTITFTATAKGKSDSRSANVVVQDASGSLEVIVNYVAFPVINSIEFSAAGTSIWKVNRTDADATTHTPFHMGTTYTVALSFDPAPDGALDLQDSCGGTIAQPLFTPNVGSASGSWTPTVDTGACIVTARLTRQSLVDSFPVVVLPVQ